MLLATRSIVTATVVTAALLWTSSASDQDDNKAHQANQLFQSKMWAEARAAYDKIAAAENDSAAPVTRQAVQRAVQCSVMLEDWDDALHRAIEFRDKKKKREPRTWFSSENEHI